MSQQRIVTKIRSLGLPSKKVYELLTRLVPAVAVTETSIHELLLQRDFQVQSETCQESEYPILTSVYRHLGLGFNVETQVCNDHVLISVISMEDTPKAYYEMRSQHPGDVQYFRHWLNDFTRNGNLKTEPETSDITTLRFDSLCTWLLQLGWVKINIDMHIPQRYFVVRWRDAYTLRVENHASFIFVAYSPLGALFDHVRLFAYTESQERIMRSRVRQLIAEEI